MSELAFNANGESFDVPAAATAWRVRRMKPRGAPELVYAQDGRPLSLPIDAQIEELRDAVDASGKYRLDAMNEDGKCMENVSPAYVHVNKDEIDDDDPVEPGLRTAAPSQCATNETVREAMRLNTALAKSVIDRFPDMMHAAAELLRAADGAGIPSREARVIGLGATEGEEEVAEPPAESKGFDLNAIVGHIVATLASGVLSGNVKLPGLAGVVDWRKAAALADASDMAPQTATRVRDTSMRRRTTSIGRSQAEAAKPTPQPTPLDPRVLAHFAAIQAALRPEEAALARTVAAELAPDQLRTWFDELSKLSVADAVAKIRSQIADGDGGES